MQQQTVNRSFLFAGNFPVYNSGDGLFDGQQAADFTINGRVLYEFDTINLRFDAFNGNPYFCNISSGRPYAVEFGLGGLAALIKLIENRKNAPQGKFLPLAVTAYNQNSLQYQLLGFASVTENSVTFYASNGSQQQQFTIKGDLQIEMFLGYLNTLQKLAIEVIAGKELARYNSRARNNGVSTVNGAPVSTPAAPTPASSTPTATAAPTTSPAPAAPTQTSAPTTAAAPATSPAPAVNPAPTAPTQTSTPETASGAPVIDMPEINI